MPFVPILMPNVICDIARSRYNITIGQTSAPTAVNLTGVMGNISPMLATDYQTLTSAPQPALQTTHLLIVGPGTDIIAGDVVTKMTLLDGVTPWTGFGPLPGQLGYGGVVWWVRFHQESAPGLLSYRSVYLERVTVSGPAA